VMNPEDCMKKGSHYGHLSFKENSVLFVFSSININEHDATPANKCPAGRIWQSHWNPDRDTLCLLSFI